ncbi:MAG TPA: anhydro-N-acetylmuramic acid kinase [Flavitalea sp.]|nr:anhydro-N-acetylmuramic acid kinase [Flavitalea sp.]
MVYRVIGLMSGSSLDGLDIAFVELHESSGKWSYELRHCACYPYSEQWIHALKTAPQLSALDYHLLHTSYGRYLGEQVSRFIQEHELEFQVQLIASHGHTTFHYPGKQMTAQLGDGAAIAAATGINVVSDLRSLDVALGGHGAPIVPIGEKLLLPGYDAFLNIGGIANLSWNLPRGYIAFDVAPANRVLNMLANELNVSFDKDGALAAEGNLIPDLLTALDQLDYYHQPYPKSLGNQFGTNTVYPMLHRTAPTRDLLRTFTKHLAVQVRRAVAQVRPTDAEHARLMITGGGAHNKFLISAITEELASIGVEAIVPDNDIVDFKEAVIMGLIGVLRWREENNVLASVTGASRNSIGGAVWIGQEA